MTTATRLYGVVGDPVHHSLSPLLHNTGFSRHGLAALMLPWRIPAGRLDEFIRAMRLLGIAGVAVTLPHKEQALAAADDASPRARAAGAANFLALREDGTVFADNTDIPGFAQPLAAAGLAPVPALVLGAGGAARAALAGLRELGFPDLAVTSPSGRGRALAGDFGAAVVPWEERGRVPAELVVNTTPLGMAGPNRDATPYPAALFAGRRGLAYDIVYTPRETRFLREAAAAGWRTLGGLEMFLAQADQQFRAWTGLALPPESGEAVRRALAASHPE